MRALLRWVVFSRILLACPLARADWVTENEPSPESTREPEEREEPLTPRELKLREEGKSTSRIGVGFLASGVVASDRGGAGASLALNHPLWFGTRYGGFQWVAGLSGSLGGGFGRHTVALLNAGPDIGFNVYCGSVFGFELRHGLALAGYSGAATGVGLGVRASFSYVFRFWSDDRTRIKLDTQVFAGGSIVETGSRPASDTPFGLANLGMGLVYETPY